MPTTYFSPGVYVEEVASGSAPIAGVGTSTAGFIGIIAAGNPSLVSTSETIPGIAATQKYDLAAPAGVTEVKLVKVTVNDIDVTGGSSSDKAQKKWQLVLKDAPKDKEQIKV